MSAPGMMTSRPTPAFCSAVEFTASSDRGLRTNGNASANARRLSLHAAITQPPMRSLSEPTAAASRAYGSFGEPAPRACTASAPPAAASGAGSTAGSALGGLGKTRSPCGMGAPCAFAMSATRAGSVVTTITGTPAARTCAAYSPTCSFKPATMTAMSSPENGVNGRPSRYMSDTRACGDALANAWRTCACTSPGALSSR